MPGLVERNQEGRREDLADLIAIADVKSTPFISQIPKGREPVNTLFDWQVDKYEDPVTTGVVDGRDETDFENAAQNRVKLRNHVQVFRRTAKVSRLAENVSDVAGLGRKKELANAVRKKLIEVKRDIEATMLSSNEAQDDNGAVPNKTRGMGTWIQTGAQSYLPVGASYRPVAAQVITTATASLTEETDVQGMLKAIYDATGFSGDYCIFAGSTLRRALTTMTRTGAVGASEYYTQRTFNQASTDKKIVATTAIYEGDYGLMRIISSNFIGYSAGTVDVDRGYVFPMDKVHLRWNQMPVVDKLPDLGGGPRVLVEAVCGLQVDNPLGMGKFQP